MTELSQILKCIVGVIAALTRSLLVLLALMTSPAWSEEAAPKNIGFVLDVSGQCFWDRSPRPLEVGQRLAAGATLHFPAQHNGTDYVEIALRDGTKLSVHCDEPGKCDAPIRLPEGSEGNPIMRTILDSLLPQQRQYVVPITRGLRLPRELVLELAGGQVDVSSVFEKEKEGVYQLVLDPISTSAVPTSSAPITVSVSWSPGHSSPVTGPGLRPGLFEASVPQLQIDEVWVLIATSSHYRSDVGNLEDAARLARGWQLSAQDQHRFLRTYLASLASRTSNEDP